MHIVQVRLRKPRRVFPFLCDSNLGLVRDEPCIVQTDRGTEWGTCLMPPEPIPYEMERRYSMRVLRKANTGDHDTQRYLVTEEQKARKVAFDKIRRHNLPMKLVDVEYTFDKQKIVFYFTAEDRVDFRDLVRDLAHDLRARIELRHIQVRDEAKMVGGIGGCGRELCCTTWLNDFMPISMRMAKRQNLSLNPSKISGQCGRLLCCLSYENDQYEAARKQAKQQEQEARARGPQEGEEEGGGEQEDRPRQEQRPPRRDDRGPRGEGGGRDRGQGGDRGGERGGGRGGDRGDRGGGRGGDRGGRPQGAGGGGGREGGRRERPREGGGGGERPREGGGGERNN